MSMQGSAIQYEVRRPVSFAALLFGSCAAPIFWLGQEMLSYVVTAHYCYPGDHPEAIASMASLRAAMFSFDTVAILAAAAGGITAWLCFLKTRPSEEVHGSRHLAAAEGRAHFLSLWGLFSSLWFFGAIVFNTIASIAVPLCIN